MEYRGPCRSAWLFLYAEKGKEDLRVRHREE
jgi:hypothetical protein